MAIDITSRLAILVPKDFDAAHADTGQSIPNMKLIRAKTGLMSRIIFVRESIEDILERHTSNACARDQIINN
jgi:hypothetical protein